MERPAFQGRAFVFQEEGTMEFDHMEVTSPAPGIVQINHAPSLCKGEYCAIHNPSDHHMREWPTQFSERRHPIVGGGVFVLTERVCRHGIGHPDPDSLNYATRAGVLGAVKGLGIHGCDRCCMPKVMMGRYELGTLLEVRVSHHTFYSRVGRITGWDDIMGCDRYTLQWVNQRSIGYDPENTGYATDSDILAVYRREEIRPK
jgi:hypothetical protein